MTGESNKVSRLIFFVIQAEEVTPTARKATASVDEPTVTIFGQVHRQGKYTLKPGMTLGDLLQQANGFASRADVKNGELERKGLKQPVDLQNTKFALVDGDVVIIREAQ